MIQHEHSDIEICHTQVLRSSNCSHTHTYRRPSIQFILWIHHQEGLLCKWARDCSRYKYRKFSDPKQNTVAPWYCHCKENEHPTLGYKSSARILFTPFPFVLWPNIVYRVSKMKMPFNEEDGGETYWGISMMRKIARMMAVDLKVETGYRNWGWMNAFVYDYHFLKDRV